MDRSAVAPDGGSRDPEAAEDGGQSARASHRSGRGGSGYQQSVAPVSCGLEGSTSPHRFFYLPWTYGGRQDFPGQKPSGIHVRRSRRLDPNRHVGIHGEVYGFPLNWLTAGIRRLGRRRATLRGGTTPSLLSGPIRRNREGSSGRDASSAADSGGGQNHGQPWPQNRFPKHDHYHDLERGR